MALHASSRLLRRALPILGAALFLMPLLAAAQPSASTVLQNVVEAYEQRMEGVEDFAVVTAMEGDMQLFDSMTTYYKRIEEDGQTTFQTRSKMEGGIAAMAGNGADSPTQADPFTMNRKFHDYFADTAEYEGTETVDGEETHIVYVEDMTPLYRDMMEEEGQPMPDSFAVRDARLYVDADDWIVRKMNMTMMFPVEGEQELRTMESTVLMQDYREVGSLLYPFTIVNSMSNVLSDEQRAEMEKQMEEARAQLDQLPEAQREQMEQMLEASRGALGEKVEFKMVAQDVRVNEGVPDGMN